LTFLAGVLSTSSTNNTLNDIEPGLLGFLVVAGIGIVLVFLLRSMNKQLRKIPPPEDADTKEAAEDDADATADSEDAKRG
jgi:hypothetical protein